MTAPDKRRPLPALVAIAALTLLTALVWFRVLHRGTEAAGTSETSTKPCPTPSVVAPTVLPQPRLITLLVLNSTSRNGLAKGVKTLLTKDGFKVAEATNDKTSYGGHGVLPGIGEIRFGPSARAAATLLSYYVPGATLVPTDSSATSVILSLGAKYKALAPAASVSTALSTHHLTVTSTSPSPQPTPSKTC
jgi:hypothetical protein